MTRSPDHVEKTGGMFTGLAYARPRAMALSPEDARRGAAQDTVRYVLAIFIAGAASVLVLAFVSSLGVTP